MFDRDPKARADLTPGTLYAILGMENWVYYGQISSTKTVGFLRRRDREPAESITILSAPMMAKIAVMRPSIGRAVRAGRWKKMGRFDLHHEIVNDYPVVQWPVGTLKVTVWTGKKTYETQIDDPAIQDLEIIAGWDAEYHIPLRLVADYGTEPAVWHVGGPVFRQRRVQEEYAKRFPEAAHYKLPINWVSTEIN